MNHLEKIMRDLPQEFDAALITSDVNRRYYTGFASSAGTLVVTREKSYFIIDSRYFEAAENKIENAEIILQGEVSKQILELLKKHEVKTVGIESETMTLADFQRLNRELQGVTVSQSSALSKQITAHREIKSAWELENIQKAQDNTDLTFSHIIERIKPGMTEKEIALEMEFFSRQNGSEEPAFSFIVAAGKNSSMPHAVPSNYKVQTGDFITMDFGSTIGGYRSDMTRTVAVGEVSAKQKEVYELVLEANLKSLEAIKAGVVCSEVDGIARELIDGSSYKGLFGHGLGHSLGLEIHENPRFAPVCDDLTQVGHVMSVEPGIYIPGEFGVRIEDIVSITQDGYHNFTKSTKKLLVL